MPGNPDKPDKPEDQYLEIPITGPRWVGLIAYILLFAAVAAVVILLLIQLGSPLPMAITAVVVMIAGMLFMAHLVRRNTH